MLTLKGRDCLSCADVIVYDYLANPDLLAFAPPDAEQIYAGKQAGNHALSQAEINTLLAQHGAAGKVVVRLKGGDPFLFGRGSEEAEALQAAGVPFEVVPGVSSALAVPAYAGIPLTHRGLASTVAIATAHEDPTKQESALDWTALAAADTLVLLMGVGNLPEVVARLVDAGRPASTPVALIRWGTRPEQETVCATLGSVESVLRARAQPFRPPAIIVVGNVVALREQLRWYDRDPLFGRRILVTRSRDRASDLSSILRTAGAIPVELPALQLAPCESADLDAALRSVAHFDWVVFTSSSGVAMTVNRLAAVRVPIADLATRKVAVIGPATAREAKRLGLTVAYQPADYQAEALAQGLPLRSGERVLLAVAEAARPALRERLLARGADVIQVPVYRSLPADGGGAALRRAVDAGIDAATFASSLTVQNFAVLAREAGYASVAEALHGAAVACIGPVTAATAREEGLEVAMTAQEHTIPALVEALRQHFATGGR